MADDVERGERRRLFKGIPDQLDGVDQENILTLLATNDEFCKIVVSNVALDLWSNEYMREIAVQCKNYIHEYGKAPGVNHLRDLLEAVLNPSDKNDGKAKAKAELVGGILDNIQRLVETGYNPEFVVNCLAKFVRKQELKKAVVAMYEAAESGNIHEADKAIDHYRSTSYTRFSPGLRLSTYVRSLDSDNRNQPAFALGIPPLDRYGIAPTKKELFMFMAPPKRGKTHFGIHCIKQALLNRQRVLAITLEVHPEIMAFRLLQSFFAMTRSEVDVQLPRIDKDSRGRARSISLEPAVNRIALSSKKGRQRLRQAFGLAKGGSVEEHVARVSRDLIIQGFPTGQLTVKELEAYMDSLVAYEKFQPDVVVLDYPDLMYVDPRNYRLNLGLLNKDLRGLAVERNFALVAMSQSNRASVSKRTITETDAAEDFSKVAISDVVLTYSQIPAEREMHVARIFVAAARNAPDKFAVHIAQSYDTGQFCTESFNVKSFAEYERMLPRAQRRDGVDDDVAEEDD